MVKYNVKTQTTAASLFVTVIAALLVLAFAGWVFMLLLGMFAGYMAMPGLALGYWASVGILTMGRLALLRIETDD